MLSAVWTRLHPHAGFAIYVAAAGDAITDLAIGERDESFLSRLRTARPALDWRRDDEDWLLRQAAAQLRAYFQSALRRFDLPLDARGSRFQKTVWEALQTVPYGQTCTYGQIAQRIGSPTASRAVGAAVGANPIAIVIPCHRVIAASGGLVGYRYGIATKGFLLELERCAPR